MARVSSFHPFCIAVVLFLLPFAQALPLRNPHKLIPGFGWTLRGHVPALSKPSIPVYGVASHSFSSSRVSIRSEKGASQILCDVLGSQTDLMTFKPVVQTAIDVIKDTWTSSVPVRTLITFSSMDDPDILAQSSISHAVEVDGLQGFLPVAAAKALTGIDMNSHFTDNRKYDVLVTLNSGTPWHASAADTLPSDKYDLVTVLIHEFYHGMMLAGSVTVDSDRITALARLEAEEMLSRFDSFLADKYACGILHVSDKSGSWKNNDKVAVKTVLRPKALADVILRSDLYFSYLDPVNNLSPLVSRISLPGSHSFISVTDSFKLSERFLSSSVPRGRAARTVGPKLWAMQVAFLDKKLTGAKKCTEDDRRPLLVRQAGDNPGGASPSVPPEPTTVVPVTTANSATTAGSGGAGGGSNNNNTTKSERKESRRIAGLPVWAFVLVILFSILALAILLGLCFMLFSSLRKKKPISPKSYFYTYTSKSRSKSARPGASGSHGEMLSSEHETIEAVDAVRATENGGPVMTPTIKSSTRRKPKTTVKKSVYKSSSSSSVTRKPATTITKSRTRPRHHHHHHHHHHHRRHDHHHRRHDRHHHHCHYVCHCCRCKGRKTVASPSSTTSMYKSSSRHPTLRHTTTCKHRGCKSATTCRHSLSKSTTVPPAPAGSTGFTSSRKCCPCKKCTTTNTIRIHVS